MRHDAFYWKGGFLFEKYDFFEEGIRDLSQISLIDFKKVLIINALLFVDDYILEDYNNQLPFNCNWVVCSVLDTITDAEMADPYDFIDRRFHDLSIYFPGITWGSIDNKKPTDLYIDLAGLIDYSDLENVEIISLD